MKNEIYALLAQADEDIFCLQRNKLLYTEFSLFQNQLRMLLMYFHVLPESINWKFHKGIFLPDFNGEIMIHSYGYGHGDAGYFYALVDKFQLAMFINLYFWQSSRDHYNELYLNDLHGICSSVVDYLEDFIKQNNIDLISCIITDN
ncbi:MAG: hypothetical protein L0G48_08160 [Staphylococcus equorum]|nr:hypothetical protein [Acinetobacter sp.]MDN5638105.1 hypothetical protein [Staphylococcus equorum]